MPARRLVLIVIAAFLLLPAPLAAAEDESDPVPLDTAWVELKILSDAVKRSKSINEEIIGALDAVANAYHNLQSPAEPEYQEVPEGALEEEKKAIEAKNEKIRRTFEAATKAHGRSVAKFKKDAEKQFIKAFKLQKIHVRSESNTRDDVNVRAVQVLGATGNPKVAEQIIKALDKAIFKSKIDATTLLLDEAFAALGKLQQTESLEWMIESFTHGKSSPRKEVDRLMSAHKAMILFPREAVPGKVRYRLVQDMVKTYSGVESQANQSSTDPAIRAKKDFWDRIKKDTIKAVQYFTFEPKNDEGEVLATMAEFGVWFRKHKNPKRDPWKDEKKDPK